MISVDFQLICKDFMANFVST